ncbi:hypothetical protein JZ751_013987, partial [Albula glossodonta]
MEKVFHRNGCQAHQRKGFLLNPHMDLLLTPPQKETQVKKDSYLISAGKSHSLELDALP